MPIKTHRSLLVATGLLFGSAPALADKDEGMIFGYNLGIGYEFDTSYAQLSYDAPMQKAMPENCANDPNNQGSIRCSAYLQPEGSSTPTLFLEAPFKRQGLLYFEPGFTFSTVSYTGGLAPKPQGPGGGQVFGPGSGQAPSQPLALAYMELYGIDWQGYIRFGITPYILPDILISLGAGVQTVGGLISVFGIDYTRFIAQPDLFGEVDLVFLRVGTGSLSFFLSQDQTVLNQFGTQAIPDNPNGTPLTTFSVSLVAASSGIRLLIPF